MNLHLVLAPRGLGSSLKEIFGVDAGSLDPLGQGRPTLIPSASVLLRLAGVGRQPGG